MVKRSERLAFMRVIDGNTPVYKRMTGFTEFAISNNPKEYTRKYIDENTERSDVVAYSPTVSYKFDMESGNLVHEFFASVSENEYCGESAECSIIIADLSKYDVSGTPAVMRTFSIIPQNEGDDKDAYTVSGTLKAVGRRTLGRVKTADKWQTVTFEEL